MYKHSMRPMLYLPVPLLLFVLFMLLLPILWLVVTVSVAQVAVAKLGFDADTAIVILILVLLGSTINIPLYRVESQVSLVENLYELQLRQYLGIPLKKLNQYSVVALNIGGGLIPTLLALYQLSRVSPWAIGVVTVVVAIVSFWSAEVVPGIGIQMNPLIAPLTAVGVTFLVTSMNPAPVAFAGGVLGTLIGADLLHLKEISQMTPGVVSIGGAGVFDGIALCGLLALLLA
jgi:uncharacterized membrane protein